MKFQVCLNELSKSAGLLDTIKDVALTEVKGTKPWILGRGTKAPVSGAFRKATSPAAQSGVRRAVTGAGQGGVYDVSEMARQMGIK